MTVITLQASNLHQAVLRDSLLEAETQSTVAAHAKNISCHYVPNKSLYREVYTSQKKKRKNGLHFVWLNVSSTGHIEEIFSRCTLKFNCCKWVCAEKCFFQRRRVLLKLFVQSCKTMLVTMWEQGLCNECMQGTTANNICPFCKTRHGHLSYHS